MILACCFVLSLLSQHVAARANGAAQCNVPLATGDLNGMGGRTFTPNYSGTQAVIGTPATANAGQPYTITLTSAGNILGILVSVVQAGNPFGTFTPGGKIKLQALCTGAAAMSTVTHNALINAASVPLTFNIPAGASGTFTIQATMLIGASGTGDSQNFYSQTKDVTIAGAPVTTTTKATTKATPPPTPPPTVTTTSTKQAPQPTPSTTKPPQPTPAVTSPTPPPPTPPPPTPVGVTTTMTMTDPCPKLSSCASCLENSACKWCPVAGNVGCTLSDVPCGGSIRMASLCSTSPAGTTARKIPTLPANSVPATTSQMLPGTDPDGRVLSCEPGWLGCTCKGGGGGICNYAEATCQDGVCLVTGCVRGKLGCACKAGNLCDAGVCNGGFCTMTYDGFTCSEVGGEVGCYCTPAHGCVDEGTKCIGGLVCGYSGACYAGDAGCRCGADDACRDAEFVECRETQVLSKATKMLMTQKYCMYKKAAISTSPVNDKSGALSSSSALSMFILAATVTLMMF